MADLKRHEELVVITKTYDLILWSCNHTGKFPRNHRFVLGERTERNLYDLLETLIQAKYTKQRQPLHQAEMPGDVAAEAILHRQRFHVSVSPVRREEMGKAGDE